MTACMDRRMSVARLSKGLTSSTTWAHQDCQRTIPSREAAGPVYPLQASGFVLCWSYKKKKKKENSFQVDHEHVTPWGCSRMGIETGSGGH